MRLPLVAFSLMASVVSAQSWPIDDCGLQPPGSVPEVPLPLKDWEPLVTADSPALVRPDVAPKASERSRMVLRELIALHRHGNKK